MKHIFKRLLTLSLAALLCAGVMFANTATVHAEDDPYDFSTHESGEDTTLWIIIMDTNVVYYF